MSIHQKTNNKTKQNDDGIFSRKQSVNRISWNQTIHQKVLQRAIEIPLAAGPEAIMQFQRLHGNQAVRQLLSSASGRADLNSIISVRPFSLVQRTRGGKNHTRGKSESPFSTKVNGYDSHSFLGLAFTDNHIMNIGKLHGRGLLSVAIDIGTRRGLEYHTQLFLDSSEGKELANEIKAHNVDKHYFKKIKKEGGTPANVLFYSDIEVEYVTVHRGPNGFELYETGVGRIVYTVANAGKIVEKVPLYCINHLDSMQKTGDSSLAT